jgi:hypothetical protein
VRTALLVLAALAQDPVAASEVLTVQRSWTGENTLIDKAEYHRITDADAWTTLWQRHAGKRERAPEVNFDKHMVVAVFLGRVTYDQAAVHAVKKTKDEIVFGIEVEDGDCCDFSTHPLYLIAVVPRSNLKLSIISRVRSGTDVDPRKDEVLKEFAKVE